jgi:hypothetical protein
MARIDIDRLYDILVHETDKAGSICMAIRDPDGFIHDKDLITFCVNKAKFETLKSILRAIEESE